MAQRKIRAGGLARAITVAKSITGLTEKINKVCSESRRLTVQAVSQWEDVPADRCLEVEKATGVSRYELRPDIYGRAPRDKSARPNQRAQARAAAA